MGHELSHLGGVDEHMKYILENFILSLNLGTVQIYKFDQVKTLKLHNFQIALSSQGKGIMLQQKPPQWAP